jgi:hypothetical protein
LQLESLAIHLDPIFDDAPAIDAIHRRGEFHEWAPARRLAIDRAQVAPGLAPADEHSVASRYQFLDFEGIGSVDREELAHVRGVLDWGALHSRHTLGLDLVGRYRRREVPRHCVRIAPGTHVVQKPAHHDLGIGRAGGG